MIESVTSLSIGLCIHEWVLAKVKDYLMAYVLPPLMPNIYHSAWYKLKDAAGMLARAISCLTALIFSGYQNGIVKSHHDDNWWIQFKWFKTYKVDCGDAVLN